MIHIDKTIVVEGKYDRMRVGALFDCPVIETGGFRFLKGGETAGLIKKAAAETGIIILTDSDSAGLKIRAAVKQMLPEGSVCLDAFVPSVEGREKRKSRPGAEGLLGVEGISDELIIQAVTGAAGECAERKGGEPLTAYDLYDAGLSGRPDSALRRKELLRSLGLPAGMSSGQFIRYMNGSMGGDRAREIISSFRTEQ